MRPDDGPFGATTFRACNFIPTGSPFFNWKNIKIWVGKSWKYRKIIYLSFCTYSVVLAVMVGAPFWAYTHVYRAVLRWLLLFLNYKFCLWVVKIRLFSGKSSELMNLCLIGKVNNAKDEFYMSKLRRFRIAGDVYFGLGKMRMFARQDMLSTSVIFNDKDMTTYLKGLSGNVCKFYEYSSSNLLPAKIQCIKVTQHTWTDNESSRILL